MKIWQVSLLSCLLYSVAEAQVSREEALSRVNTSASIPVRKESMIWAMTASDDELIRGMEGVSKSRQYAAAMEVQKRKRPRLVAALIHLLSKSDKYVGQRILYTLEKINTVQSQEAIKGATKHWSGPVRWSAAIKSAMWGYKPAIGPLREALGANFFGAARAMGAVGDKSDWIRLKRVYRQYVDVPDYGPEFQERGGAILSLAELSEPWALTVIRKAAYGDDKRVPSYQAISVLTKLGGKENKKLLIKCLTRNKFYVRFPAVEALGILQSMKAIPTLRKIESGDIPEIHGTIVEARYMKYAGYVVDCIEAGRKPILKREWPGKKVVLSQNSCARF